MKTILVAQGGGPTAVINRSLAGIVSRAGATGTTTILGARWGVRGIIEEDFHDLTAYDDATLQAMATAPGAALGSTRDKPDDAYCDRILDVCKKRHIDALFYIGGNDSSAALAMIETAKASGDDRLHCVHVPKTIDNDLVENDHTPGYPSAARFVALAFAGIDCDQRSLPGVHIGVTMGRHAGFLTAAAVMARQGKNDGPHIVCLPEQIFDTDAFLGRVDDVYRRFGRCLIAVSEGIADAKGRPIAAALAQDAADAYGNVQLSGNSALGDALARDIKTKLKISRVRADTFGYAQRCFPTVISTLDAQEAWDAGIAGVDLAREGRSGSITLKREDGVTVFRPAALKDIGGKTRTMPSSWQLPFDVHDDFRHWLEPLLGDPLPRFTRLSD